MKKSLLCLSLLAVSAALYAQVNWQSYPNAPTSGFWDMDTMNGKLYVSTGWVYEFDGVSTWTPRNNYNNSYNTGNKAKSCIKNINNNLYAGAKDFNTSGEGDIHFLNDTTWTIFQNTDFPYNGNYKVRAFEEYNGTIYMGGNFAVPNMSGTNIAMWNGTDWTGVGRSFGNTEIIDLQNCMGKLFLTEGYNVWSFNGTSWDSIFNNPAYPPVFPMASNVKDLVVYNGELYMSGNFALSGSGTSDLVVKYNGTSFSSVAKIKQTSSVLANATYSEIGKMGVAGNKLYMFAKKTSDNNTYLLSYDGATITEVSKVADYGDYTWAPGYEINTFKKIMQYNNDLVIGGTFSKVNGQTIGALAYVPGVVGVEEKVKTNDLIIYPNPADKFITINIADEQKNSDAEIYNAVGELVSVEKVSGKTVIINTASLAEGVYIIRVRNAQSVSTQKFIVRH